MIASLFYYIVLPFLAGAYVIRLIKKYAKDELPPDVARLIAERPVEKKWFRAVRRDARGLRMIGDYETRMDAVDAAYQACKDAKAAGQAAAFVVLNDKGEALEQVDS